MATGEIVIVLSQVTFEADNPINLNIFFLTAKRHYQPLALVHVRSWCSDRVSACRSLMDNLHYLGGIAGEEKYLLF